MANISQQLQSWLIVALDTLMLLAQVQQSYPHIHVFFAFFPFPLVALKNYPCSDNLSHMGGDTKHI